MNERRVKRTKRGARSSEGEPSVAVDLPSALVDEPESESVEAEALVDQGDGVRVRRGARSRVPDDSTYECPDEPPPGWGQE